MIALFTLLLATVQAWATPVTVTACVKAETDFLDAGANGDDLWTNNNAKVLRGIFIEIKDANTWFGNTVESGYVDPDDGCMDVQLEAGVPHWIKVSSRMELDGRDLWVTNGSSLYAVMSSGSISPSSGNTYTYTLDGAASGLEWVNVAAAASFTMARRLYAWPALSTRYEVALAAHPTYGDTRYDPGDGVVYLDPVEDHAVRKYVIAHELGHHLLHFAYWNDDALDKIYFAFNVEYGLAVDGDCPGGSGHSYTSKEYQSAAIIEGHAHYVSAVAYNFTGNNLDCRMVPNILVEWDPNTTLGGSYDAFSCEGAEDNDAGGVEYTTYGVDARDFMGDHCLGSTNGNRGVELDWLRLFWDAENDEGAGFTFGDSIDVLVFAEPAEWKADDTGTNTYPMHAVRNAFDDTYGLGFEDVWDDWATTNGVER